MEINMDGESLKKRGLTKESAAFRVEHGYTPEQAERLPGRHKARHVNELKKWVECFETRDESGQLIAIDFKKE